MRRRVMVTGYGVISPIGNDAATFWEAALAGKAGIGRITRFDVSGLPVQIAGEVRDFEPGDYMDRKEAKRTDRFSQFAVACTAMALEDAGLTINDGVSDRTAVILGTGIGGIGTLTEQQNVLQSRGPDRVSPFFIPMMIANMAAGQVSMVFGAKGPNATVVTACAAATHAIGEAFRLVGRGESDVAITGGSEAPLVPLALAGFTSMRALSTRNDDPASASRPFDRDRDGFVMAEGAGILVLEEYERAVARGARIHGEILGYGSTADAYHVSAPPPDGDGGVRAMRAALSDAGVSPGEIGYINAHGTSTPLNDKLETLAIKRVFGEHAHRIPISSIKSMIGHMLGAAGAVESVATLLALREGMVPPTVNLVTADPECDLDYTANVARPLSASIALKNSFGFGGQNACLVIGRVER